MAPKPTRQHLLALFVAGLLALGAAAGLADLAGYPHVLDRLFAADPVWLPVCFGGEVLAYFGYVLAVRNTARVDGGPKLSLGLTTRTVIAGFGVFAATRASGGFAVDYWALRRAGEKREGAVARVLGLGALEYAVLAPAALACAVFLIVEDGGARIQLGLTLPWLAVLPGFLVAAWLTSPERCDRLCDPGDGGRLRQMLAHAVSGIRVLRCLVERPRQHGFGFVGAALYWLGDIACLWAALRVFHYSPELPALVLAYATGYVVTRRSLPAGGAGIVEVLLTLALTWVGVGWVPALLGVVTYRIFNFWLPILPALAVLPSISRLTAEFRRAESDVERAGRVAV